jgi:hypothetical protein
MLPSSMPSPNRSPRSSSIWTPTSRLIRQPLRPTGTSLI